MNQLELGLNMRSLENTTRILKMADSYGIKVMFSVVRTVDRIMVSPSLPFACATQRAAGKLSKVNNKHVPLAHEAEALASRARLI